MSARTVDEIICCPGGDCSKGETCGAETIGPEVRAALTAAGYAVVPREPTREMWAASANALVNERVKLKAHHDYISGTVWSAMLAAGEATP